jgi:excisionase family DNA binding protein
MTAATVREVLTTIQAADYLQISKQKLEIARHRGGGPAFCKIGRIVRYRKSDLDAYLAEHVYKNTTKGCAS